MRDQTLATQTIVQRLEKIEKQNRTMKCAGLAVLIGVGSIVLMGQASPQSRTIDAEAFVLRDAGGKMRASLRMDTILNAPQLKLYDPTGKSRVEITADAKQPSIWLFDAEGRKRAAFATDEDSAGLQLFDPTGKVGRFW